MIPPSACPSWQPDIAANAAQEHHSYTTSRDTIHNGLFVNLFRIFGRRVESAGTGAGFGDPVFLSIEARIRVRAR
jgi:hypothetical protein